MNFRVKLMNVVGGIREGGYPAIRLQWPVTGRPSKVQVIFTEYPNQI